MHDSLLKLYGFKSAGTCHCDGVYTVKYKRDNILIKARPRRNQHKIYQNNQPVTGWVNITELTKQLNELFKENIKA